MLSMTINVYADNNEQPQESQLEKDLQYIGNIIRFIESSYALEVTEEELIEGAIKGIFSKLDPYSQYYTPEEFKELNENVSGNFGGIGVHITYENGYVTVLTPIEGTPGFKAGLKPGDKIVSVDDKEIIGFTTKQAADLIRGEPGTKVKLGVIREGSEEILYFNITREIIKINPITYKILDDNIGYIRISEFNSNTFENISNTLKEFDDKGIRKIIIDLRNNPGGYLSEVVDVLRMFVPEGPIVHIKKPDGSVETYNSFLKKPKYDLAVIVNEGSASASEIFAGAVQDTQVGKIIGKTTYGKGTVQSVFPLTNGGGIKITTAEYFTAKENKVNGVGIKPDIVVENSLSNPKITIDELKYLNRNRKPSLGTVGLDVLAAEKALKVLGYNINDPDGILDEITFNTIKEFQIDKGLFGYGVLDFTTQDALLNSVQKYTNPEIIDKQLEKAIEVLKEM
jgi:carboxyl-terminal processing protease